MHRLRPWRPLFGLLALFFLSSPSQADAKKCPPGQYGVFKCFKCPAGTYAYKDHIITKIGCKACPAGHYSHAGSRRCSFCPGKMNGTKCEKCAPGYYFNKTHKQCVRCLNATYSTTYGAYSCKTCPKGTIPNRKSRHGVSTGCVKCKAGQFQQTITECAPCPNQRTSKAGTPGNWTKACYPCPRGTYGVIRGSGPMTNRVGICLPCPPGTFADGTATKRCKPCWSGSFSSKVGAISSKVCKVCPNDFEPNKKAGANTCTRCKCGYRSAPSAGQRFCIKCPAPRRGLTLKGNCICKR